jgi:hypothetical protein
MNVQSNRRLMIVPLTGLVLLALAACGSSGGPSVAHLPSGKKASQSASAGAGASQSFAGGPSAGVVSGSGAQLHAAIRMDGVSGSNAVRFSACIRAHGVPDFPDPNAQGVFSLSGADASLPQTAQFQRASTACRSLLHLGGAPPSPATRAKVLAALLKYSQCMRSHGVTNFPDPTTSGGAVGLTLGSSSGVNPQSPIFQRAQRACASLQPGGPGAGP